MSEPQTEWLHELMKRLGKAVHGGIIRSDEIQSCLQQLREAGWDAVMLLEASVVFRENGQPVSEEASLHIHADPRPRHSIYRLSQEDAAFLASLGISPSRYRSLPSPPASSARSSHEDAADG